MIDLLQKFVNIGKTAASRLKTLAQEAETESEVYEDNTHTHTHTHTIVIHLKILVEDFLEDKMKEAEFIRNFKEKRKVSKLIHYWARLTLVTIDMCEVS